MSLARIDKTSTAVQTKTPGGRVPTGFAEETVISDSTFRTQHLQYERRQDGPPAKKRKREGGGDSSIVYGPGAYKGPWARYQEVRPDVNPAEDDVDAEDVEEVEEISEYEEDAIQNHSLAKPSKAGTLYGESTLDKETTEFHGTEEFDYQGRTYMHVPQDLNINLTGELSPYTEMKNYHPKKQIHTFKHASQGNKAHTRSVTQTRFFPNSGHLLLSAGADGKVLLWDMYHQRALLRSYTGHSKSANDIDFAPDGTQFLSASFDRSIKLWDTETGACTARFSAGATPHVVRFNPAQPNEFLAGLSNNKIVQFDTRVDNAKKTQTEPVQVYDYHLSNVNTLTFCDEDRRFISTSDDKSLRQWEVGIGVPIKLVQEPDLFSLTRASAHPSGKYVAYQSADNQILVYGTEKVRQNRKKGFKGHNTAGYAIDVACSPDGSMVATGDSAGYAVFFDWKTCKMWHKVQASKEGAVVSLGWHPRETSKVVTGDTAGNLKLWD